MEVTYLKYISTLFILVLFTSCSFGQKNKIEENFSTEGKKVKYAYSLPTNYEEGKSYNILIAPGGGTADDSDDFLFWGKKTGGYDWILIETNAVYRPGSMKIVKEFLEHLKKELNPSGNKFHIMGFSANSADAFKIALALPDYFHSITGVPGHPRTNDEKELLNLKAMKVNFIVGENDSYWLSSAKKFNDSLHKLGVEVKLNIVDDGGHVLREIKGDRFIGYMEWVRE